MPAEYWIIDSEGIIRLVSVEADAGDMGLVFRDLTNGHDYFITPSAWAKTRKVENTGQSLPAVSAFLDPITSHDI